jgi:hypothetical protein
LGKFGQPGQTHPTQKLGWVGWLGEYKFQNWKTHKKNRVPGKIGPNPKNPQDVKPMESLVQKFPVLINYNLNFLK